MSAEARGRPDWPSPRTRQVLKGLVLGGLLAGNALLFGVRLPWVEPCYTLPLWFVVSVAAMLAPPAWRRAYWALVLLLVLCGVVVGGTPLTVRLSQRWVVDDGVAPADLLVVLSGGTYDEHLPEGSQDRFLYGLRLLQSGAAPRVCFTSGNHERGNRYAELCLEFMRDLQLDTSRVVPFAPVDMPVMNTYGEALSIAAMAPPGGWGRVLVVTSPHHTRRARAVFRAAGLDADATPCPPSSFRWPEVVTSSERIKLFGTLLYEYAGWLVYRHRGWL